MRVIPRGVLAVAVALAFTSCADDTNESAVTDEAPSVPAGEIFDPESDDLCEWVTGDEVVEFLGAAGAEVEGPATTSEPWTDDATGWNCAWTLASGEEIHLGVKSTNRLSSAEQLDMVTEYAEPDQVVQPGGMVSGYPNLTEGVVVENQAFGRFAFYAPATDGQLNVAFVADSDFEVYVTAVTGTADQVLSELGWLPR